MWGSLMGGHGGQDDIFQPQGFSGFGDSFGLIGFDLLRTAGINGAKSTAARADIAEDHKGGGFSGITFTAVGAKRGFANGVETVLGQNIMRFFSRGNGHGTPEPAGQSFTRNLNQKSPFLLSFPRVFRRESN